MQPHHEKGLAAEAEREVRMVRVLAHPAVDMLPEPPVLVAQRLQARPEMGLERVLGERVRTLEQHHEALVEPPVVAVGASEVDQLRQDAQVVPRGRDVPSDHDAQLVPGKRGLGADAGELRFADEGAEALGKRVPFIV